VQFIGRAVLFLIGFVLLAPGACSLYFLPGGLFLFAGLVTGKAPNGDWATFLAVSVVWVVGILIAALGVWLLAQAFKSSHGR
jgi:hypothetical protein